MVSWWHSLLVAVSRGFCWSWETDAEVFMTRSLSVMPKTTEQHLIVRSGKSDAKLTNNRTVHLRNCTVEANYWQTQSIAWPLCNGRGSCECWNYEGVTCERGCNEQCCHNEQCCVTVGTMSGGGSRVLKGKMSSTIAEDIDENSMQNLEKQLEKVCNDLNGFCWSVHSGSTDFLTIHLWRPHRWERGSSARSGRMWIGEGKGHSHYDVHSKNNF